ncbi:MAG: ribonuclease III [Aestuariivita sp.]|nr:ribonuclease III [Aestuariivita sp.]
MTIPQKLHAFEARIGYQFNDQSLLLKALTHSSIKSPKLEDNEKLEFLGDRVLALIVAEALMQMDQSATVGQLASRLNALVRKETCAEVALEIKLGQFLKLGRSEMLSGGRKKKTLLEDAMEAVIAAVYCDAGLSTTRKMVLRLWGDRIQKVDSDAKDAKTALQEWAHSQGMDSPEYTIISRRGPDHAPVFDIMAKLTDGRSDQAQAGSKRQAEQAAAQKLLVRLMGNIE